MFWSPIVDAHFYTFHESCKDKEAITHAAQWVHLQQGVFLPGKLPRFPDCEGWSDLWNEDWCVHLWWSTSEGCVCFSPASVQYLGAIQWGYLPVLITCCVQGRKPVDFLHKSLSFCQVTFWSGSHFTKREIVLNFL